MADSFKNIIKGFFQHPMLEAILAKLSAGRKPDHIFARLPAYCTAYRPNTARKVQRQGINYELDLADYMEWSVFFGIMIEPREILYQLAKPGNVIFDIGANIGEVTLNLARKVGSNGHVHSFEPDPFIFQKLLRNFSINMFNNVTLNNVGLSERTENVMLAAEVGHNRSGSRVVTQTSGSGTSVKLISLDSYFHLLERKEINLIKIDVEGYELKVLKGAEQTLRNFKPILFIELDDRNLIAQGDSAKNLVAFLLRLGYTIMNVESNNTINAQTDFADCHFDIIAR